jgi:hypothetical protein
MSNQTQSPSDQPDEKVPLRIKLKIKDFADPITVSRFGIAKIAGILFGVAVLAVLVWVQFFQPPTGDELVQDMVEAAGGAEAWNSIKSGSFKRTHNVYDETGALTSQTDETFYFTRVDGQEQLLVRHVTNEGDEVVIGRNDEGYWATVNGEATGAEEKARALGMMCEDEFCSPLCSSEMAFYRFSFPFKLNDPGVNTQMAGTTLLNGQEMMVLDVTYDQDIGSDKWVFYVDPGEKTIRKIEHFANAESGANPEEIFVSDFEKEFGINFGHKRTYYRSNGKVLEEYVFSDANFRKDVPDNFFTMNAHVK